MASLTHFHLGARSIGLLASMDGIGALAGAVILFFFASASYCARVYVWSTVTYAAAAMAMAVMPNPMLSGLALIVAGLGSSGYSIMQSTLVFNGIKQEMRGMMLGLFTVTTGMAPLGLLQIGTLAELFGARSAVLISGAEAVIAVVLTRRLWRNIRSQTDPVSDPPVDRDTSLFP